MIATTAVIVFFVAAVIAACHAAESRDRADRAEDFAQEALDDLFRMTADRDKWRSRYHGGIGALIDEVHAAQQDAPIDFELWGEGR